LAHLKPGLGEWLPVIAMGAARQRRHRRTHHVEPMARYKGRRSTFKREFPHIVEVAVPPRGLGKRLDSMHTFHTERGIKACIGRGRRKDSQDYIRWYFADATIAASFAVEFGGTLMKAADG
jgi:hypothetical protein